MRSRCPRWQALLALAVLGAGCSQTQDRALARPIPLVGTAGGLLYAYGGSRTTQDTACDPAQMAALPYGPLIFDTATPLSGFRTNPLTAAVTTMSHLNDAQLLVRDGETALAAQLPAALLCDVPLLAIGAGPGAPTGPWVMQWNAETLSSINVIVGGDILRSYSVGLTFGKDPRSPLCQAPPCVTLGDPDIADNCELSNTGEAVFPVTPTGGGLIVQVGDDVFTYPATRMTLGACLEPLGDPLAAVPPLSCLPPAGTAPVTCSAGSASLTEADQFGVKTRIMELTAAEQQAPTNLCACLLELRAAQLCFLDGLTGGQCGAGAQNVPGGSAQNTLPDLPGDLLQVAAPSNPSPKNAGPCPNLSQAPAGTLCATAGLPVTYQSMLEDIIDEEHLRDPHYEESGADVRLLVSTAVPGVLLSETAFGRLRGAVALAALQGAPADATLQYPGFPALAGHTVMLGGQSGLSAMALMSTERFLAPCAELSRSRRQRVALAQCDSNTSSCRQAACLENLQRGPQPERTCGYSGQNTQLACDDHFSPVAAAIDMTGPIEAVVIPDDSAILQAANGDVQTSTGAIDGILGVSLLAKLQVAIEYPVNRISVHCRCDEDRTQPACRTYPRYTDSDADDCQFINTSGAMCVPATPPAACTGALQDGGEGERSDGSDGD